VIKLSVLKNRVSGRLTFNVGSGQLRVSRTHKLAKNKNYYRLFIYLNAYLSSKIKRRTPNKKYNIYSI